MRFGLRWLDDDDCRQVGELAQDFRQIDFSYQSVGRFRLTEYQLFTEDFMNHCRDSVNVLFEIAHREFRKAELDHKDVGRFKTARIRSIEQTSGFAPEFKLGSTNKEELLIIV